MKELTERLTKMLPGTDIVVFTGGRYDETLPAEMTTNDVRLVLIALNEYEEKQPVINALYLEKCEEVNRLKAQLAAEPTLEELETKLLNEVCCGCGYLKNNVCEYIGANCGVSKPIYGYIKEVFAEFRKGGAE